MVILMAMDVNVNGCLCELDVSLYKGSVDNDKHNDSAIAGRGVLDVHLDTRPRDLAVATRGATRARTMTCRGFGSHHRIARRYTADNLRNKQDTNDND